MIRRAVEMAARKESIKLQQLNDRLWVMDNAEDARYDCITQITQDS
jgi:hypothetical protein